MALCLLVMCDVCATLCKFRLSRSEAPALATGTLGDDLFTAALQAVMIHNPASSLEPRATSPRDT